ncbi:MAG: S-adenosyl-L-homocysteine hydrolase [Novosphingobium sp.]|nr:S-adenosyl-L-homocysteine hydrolase [Novosphingobium sp.]
MPAQAAPSRGGAEKLLLLDIMLMVTGLRCRTSSDNFWSDYGRFTTKHMGTLNGAHHDLHSDLSRRIGSRGAKKKLDQMTVSMANRYGRGHPWLDCGQLKMVTGNLSRIDSRETLIEAADQLSSNRAIERFALAER